MSTNEAQQPKKPTHAVKVRRPGQGENDRYEQIGVAWDNGNGSMYVRLHGTQIVSEGFTLYPIERN